MQNSDIKLKIKKLLALSKSPNEAEAESAMRKANELMSLYKIDRTEFSGYISKTIKSTKKPVVWQTVLANAVERLYATYHYRDASDGTFVFFGEELDVFMSTEMLAYLMKTVNRMAKQNVRKNAKYKYRQSYCTGIADRLWDRMNELGQECSWRNPKELEEQKKEIADWVNTQVSTKTIVPKIRTGKANMTAYNRGISDADGVSLSRQMTGSGARRIGGWRC